MSHPALTNNSRGIVFMQSPGLSWSHFRSCSSLSYQWVIAGIFSTALMKYCCSLNEATSSQQAVQRCTVPDATLSRLRSNTLSKLMQSGSRALADSVGLAHFGGASSFQSMPSLSAGRRQWTACPADGDKHDVMGVRERGRLGSADVCFSPA